MSSSEAPEIGRRSVSRKSTSMSVGTSGEMRQMTETEKLREYFRHTQSKLLEDRPLDRTQLESNVEAVIAASAALQQAVMAAGA